MNDLKLKKLSPEQVETINYYLNSMGDYGEIHIIVQKGEIRYINTMESHRACTPNKKEVGQIEKHPDITS
jgi:hypothetical protein